MTSEIKFDVNIDTTLARAFGGFIFRYKYDVRAQLKGSQNETK